MIKKFFQKRAYRINGLWISGIIAVSFLAHAQYLSKSPSWDMSSYILMGKYMYSSGAAGLWEAYRPVLYPAIVGLSWKLGGEPVVWANLINICFGLGCIYAIYHVGKVIFNKNTGIISSIFLSFSSVCIAWDDTRIAATFFTLLSVYLTVKHKNFFSGALMAIAFLFNYSQFFITIPMFIAIFCRNGVLKKSRFVSVGKFLLGFLAAVSPLLIFNIIMYGNLLYPFMEQKNIIDAYSCMFNQGPFYYLKYLIFHDNPCILFLLVGAFLIMKQNFCNNKWLILLIGVVSFLLIDIVGTKQIRYLISSMPYIYLISAYGIAEAFSRLRKRTQLASYLLCVLIIMPISFWCLNTAKFYNEPVKLNIFQRYVQENCDKLKGKIWISNPSMLVYSDLPAHCLMYYPIFDINKAQSLRKGLNDADTILFVESDFPCSVPDIRNKCAAEKTRLVEDILSNFYAKIYLKDRNNKFIGGIFERQR